MSFTIRITDISEPDKSVHFLIDSVRDKLKQSTSVAIQIDLSFPQAFPVTTNPVILSSVIKELINSGVEKITIIGASYYEMSAKAIWIALGYDVHISSRFPKVQFIAVGEDLSSQSEILQIVKDAQLFLTIINPKVSQFTSLSLSIENSLYLLPYKERLISPEEEDLKYCEKDVYLKRYMEKIIDVHFTRPPDLILYDLTCIVSNAGPILFTESQFIHSNIRMLSDDSVLGDYVALLLCGMNPDENYLMEAIKNYNYSLLSRDRIEQCIVSLFEPEEEIFHQSKLTSLVTKEEAQPRINIRFWRKKEKSQQKSLVKIGEIDSYIDIYDIFPQKIEICKGIMCSGCKKAAVELLLILKSSMTKDTETLPDFSLLVGKNPIEPTHEYCIVYGDHAIESTKERKFRNKIITRTMRTETDMELERAKLKIRLQKKIMDMESHRDIILQENLEEQKRKRALNHLERKIKHITRFNNFRMNAHNKYLEHSQKHNKRQIDQEKEKANPHVLELSGCPPDPIKSVERIIKLFKKRWVPGLQLRKFFLQQFHFAEQSDEIEGIQTMQKSEMEMRS